MATLETIQLLAAAADACDSKKAEDIRLLALDPSESSLTDYFLICSGSSDRQNVAIADEVDFRLKNDFGVLPNSVEGRRQGEWVLMDYVDFVVHIFHPEKREFYALERLKKSATVVTVADLKAEIQKKLADARKKTPVVKKAVPAKKVAAGKKAAAKEAAAKKTAAKPAVKAPAKKVAAKVTAKKAVAGKKTTPKKAAAKKTR